MMDTHVHPWLIVDAKTPLVAEGLKKALGLFRFPGTSEGSQGSLEYKTVCDSGQRKELLDFLLGQARTATAGGGVPDRGPLAILQEIGLEDFERAAEMGFDCSPLRPAQAGRDRTGEDGYSHPLRYRMRLRDFAVELGWDEPLAAFATFSLPIVYFGWSRSPLEKASDELHFLDSSIWHRYVAVPSDAAGLERLIARIDDAIEGQRQGIFRATVALEYLDYAIGSLRNLHTGDIGHGPWVKPVPFQSETWADGAGTRLQTESSLDALLQRRVLLVDDFGERELKAVPILASKGESTAQETTNLRITKRDAIENALKARFSEEIHSCSTLDEAGKKLKEYERFDLILLDYLLGRDSSERRQYGTALLDKANLPGENRTASGKEGDDPADNTVSLERLHSLGHSGPMNRFWVFSVSAFPFIMESKIAAGNVASLNPSYVFDPGADPVCTPNLFRYKLFRFLQVQNQYATAPEEAEGEFFAHALHPRSGSLTKESGDEEQGYRHWAKRLYFDVTERQRVLQELQFDQDRGSLLARAVLAGSRTNDIQRIYFSLAAIFRYLGWGTGMEYEAALRHLNYLEELASVYPSGRESLNELLLKLEEDIARSCQGYV